jgi:hypothetical protein
MEGKRLVSMNIHVSCFEYHERERSRMSERWRGEEKNTSGGATSGTISERLSQEKAEKYVAENIRVESVNKARERSVC